MHTGCPTMPITCLSSQVLPESGRICLTQQLPHSTRPDWNATPGEQASHSQMDQQQVSASQNQTFTWQMAAGNSMRTVHLYGRLDNGESSSASTVDLNMNVPIHLVHPLNEDDTKPLSGMYSGVYVGFRDSRRQLIRNGANISDVLGPLDLDFRAAINPSSFHNDLPLFTWASELFGAHRNLRPSDRVACAWMVATLMRVSRCIFCQAISSFSSLTCGSW